MCYRIVSFSFNRCFYDTDIWGVVGSVVTVLLQIFSWFWEWNNFENRLMFGKVKAYKNGAIFGPPCIIIHKFSTEANNVSYAHRNELQWHAVISRSQT